MITPFKVRLRLSVLRDRGKWFACWVDEPPTRTYGVTQVPVSWTPVAWGDTPEEAYQNLLEKRQ